MASQLEVVGNDLSVGDQEMINAAFADLANCQRAIRFALSESHLPERENPHASQFGEKLHGIELMLGATQRVARKTAVFDDPVRLAHHEGTRRHEL